MLMSSRMGRARTIFYTALCKYECVAPKLAKFVMSSGSISRVPRLCHRETT